MFNPLEARVSNNVSYISPFVARVPRVLNNNTRGARLLYIIMFPILTCRSGTTVLHVCGGYIDNHYVSYMYINHLVARNIRYMIV